jgi:hypothetical protein
VISRRWPKWSQEMGRRCLLDNGTGGSVLHTIPPRRLEWRRLPTTGPQIRANTAAPAPLRGLPPQTIWLAGRGYGSGRRSDPESDPPALPGSVCSVLSVVEKHSTLATASRCANFSAGASPCSCRKSADIR